MNVFISYTTRDKYNDKAFLEQAAEYVTTFGRPYVDLLDNSARFRQSEVERRLKRADLVLVIDTPAVWTSPWVAWEVEQAINREIPLFLIPRTSMVTY